MRKHVVIDCDPGVDDALAIMLAASSPELDIRAIDPVAGNVPYVHTSDNARKLAGLLKLDCRVGRGAVRPLLRPARTAGLIHGANGMGGIYLPETRKDFDGQYAWDVLYEEACRFDGELELVSLGPMTNVAIAIQCHPDLKDRIKRITAMAGTAHAGNANRYAEFNVWVDPHACEIVLQSGIPLYICGLDGNDTCALDDAEIEEIFGAAPDDAGDESVPAYASRIAHFIHNRNTKEWDLKASNINDLCTMACFIAPEIAQFEPAHVRCELSGEDTLGQLVFCEPSENLPANVHYLRRADKAVYKQMLKDMMSAYRS